MIKGWKIFLSSILITSFVVGESKTLENIATKIAAKGSPFHPDIAFSANESQTNRQQGLLAPDSEKHIYLKPTEINWTNYANSWSQFKNIYQTIALEASGYTDGKEATRHEFSNVNISISSLEERSTWHDSQVLRSNSRYQLSYSYNVFPHGSYDYEGVYYDAIKDGDLIKIRFYLWTCAWQKGSKADGLWTESHIDYNGGKIKTNLSVDQVYNQLNKSLSNPIYLTSSYSGSLEDKNNIIDPSGKNNDETTKITNVIKSTLGEDYQYWQPYIQPFAFSDEQHQALITFKFDSMQNQINKSPWIFTTKINITLTSDYYSKSLKERLKINPGQIVNPLDSTKGMIEDQPIQLDPGRTTAAYGGNWQYHTTAHIEFDGASDGYEWMTINNKPVEVLNNKFIYNMTDNRDLTDDENNDGNDNDGNKDDNGDKNTSNNVYDIVLHREYNNYKTQYEIKYTIANLIPTLTEKWYAWDPENNPNQKTLITENLSNGKPNPKYDPEVNSKTGTKTQIIWMNRKSEYPFPLDPLDKHGDVINPNKNPENYDLGFIAEGSVAGMGVQELFTDNEFVNVWREGVDKSLNKYSNPNNNQLLKNINPDTNNKYWSWEGMWHYITKVKINEQKQELAYEKYVLIDGNYQEKYSRFLDVLNNSNIAVDFWTTIHGLHLKNYLVREKQLDSKDIAKLNYEQVASYWKEYTSDIISQRIAPDPNQDNLLDLSQINLYTIKMNLTTIELIKEEIINQVKNQLAKNELIYGTDYVITPFDDESISKLLNYDNNDNATINLTIKSLTTSIKVNGSQTIKVINNLHYDPNQVVDLSTIEFGSMPPFSFHNFTVEELKQWILKYINDTFKNNKNYIVNLEYDIDYGITPFDDETLTKFINSTEETSLEFSINALDSSLKAINGTHFVLINDPEAAPAPTTPPIINPSNPDPTNPNKGSWTSKKTNLIILSLISVLVIGGVGITIFVKYRLKKGIGGKKNSKTKPTNKTINSETKNKEATKKAKNIKIKAIPKLKQISQLIRKKLVQKAKQIKNWITIKAIPKLKQISQKINLKLKNLIKKTKEKINKKAKK